MKVFHGQRRGTMNGVVHVDGERLLLRAHLCGDEPREFDWGRGSRATCRQHLALAILSECIDDETAQLGHKSFQLAVINDLPRDEWTLTEEDVQRWHYQWKINRSLVESPSEDDNDFDPEEELVLPNNLRQGNSATNRNVVTLRGRRYPLGMIAGTLLLAAAALLLFLIGQFTIGILCSVVASAFLTCLFFYCPFCRRHFALSYQRDANFAVWRCAHCDQLTRRRYDDH